MSQSLSNRLANKLIDWLIALCGASLLLWFFVTQPVITSTTSGSILNVDIAELKQHVEFLTIGYAPRTVTYNNLNDTADYIFREFSHVGVPEYQKISTVSNEYRNISLQLGPDTREVYVIGAHYDAIDDSIDTEGNASGVATLIELARNLAANHDKLKIGVILVAYPLSLNQSDNIVNTGSYYHANSLKKINKSVRLMVSLDSVGQQYSPEALPQYPYKFMQLLYPAKENSLNLVGRFKDFRTIRELKKGFNSASLLSLNSHTLFESFHNTQSSDHVNYWNQDFPAVLISDVVNGNSNIRVKSNVQPKDRLDYGKMALLVGSLYQVVMQTDRLESERPQLAQRSRNKSKTSSLLY